jgi:hypothetical protein
MCCIVSPSNSYCQQQSQILLGVRADQHSRDQCPASTEVHLDLQEVTHHKRKRRGEGGDELGWGGVREGFAHWTMEVSSCLTASQADSSPSSQEEIPLAALGFPGRHCWDGV